MSFLLIFEIHSYDNFNVNILCEWLASEEAGNDVQLMCFCGLCNICQRHGFQLDHHLHLELEYKGRTQVAIACESGIPVMEHMPSLS